MTYYPSEPLVTVYNKVENLERLGVTARTPYYDTQLAKIGLCIIKNTRDFTDGLETWYKVQELNTRMPTSKRTLKTLWSCYANCVVQT